MSMETGVYTPDMVLGPDRKGIKVTYTTDTRPTESISRNAEGSDLFICEGMYGGKDKEAKSQRIQTYDFFQRRQPWRNARESVKCGLTHYSPSLAWPEEFLPEAKAIFPNAFLGKDGKSVELNFEE